MKYFLACLVIAITPLHAQPDLKKLDGYYSKALSDWDVPGMSIAIVKDGKIIFSKGYGTKEVDKNERPDENTLYAIASNSKAFTTAAIAKLVDQGKLTWDDKVRQYLPHFELSEPWLSNEATIRDLLCHRVGLRTFSGDLLWYRSTLNVEEMIRRIKYLQPGYSFRSGYGYSNVMYLTAGEVMKKITGESWSATIRKSFFNPLGMTRSISTTKDLQSKGNYATPHALVNGKHKPIPWEDWETVAATGGIISSVKDMSQWLIFNLNHGVWNGDTLLSKSARNILWTPHNNFTVDHVNSNRATHFNGYGLGWHLSDYHGRLRVSHSGGYSGMLSIVTLIPDENLGIVILTNGMKPIYSSLISYTLDAFLKVPVKDWSSEGLENYNKHVLDDRRIEERRKTRILNTKPSLPLENYTGIYAAPSYGDITVKIDGTDLKIYFEHTPDFTSTLKHWHLDTWEIKWDNPDILPWFSFGTIKFDMNNNGKVTGIQFDVPNNDFWFDELNAKRKN